MSSLYNQDTGRSTFVLSLISLVLVFGPLCFGGLATPYLLTSLPAPGKPGRQEMAKKVARRLCYSWASLRLNSTTFCYISIPVVGGLLFFFSIVTVLEQFSTVLPTCFVLNWNSHD